KPGGIVEFLNRLRALFGKQEIIEEDRLRAASIRSGAQLSEAPSGVASEDFLRRLGGAVSFDFNRIPRDSRPLELINKTNQFNLNGRRLTEGEWLSHTGNPRSFVLTVAYEDKFGPLGRIAVVAGVVDDGAARILSWVMSCRAFSRRIEHHTLEWLLTRLDCDRLELAFAPTERNSPLREFLSEFVELPLSAATVSLTRADWERGQTVLPHAIKESSNGFDRGAPPKVLCEGVSGHET